jgi:ribosomal protein S12 methylthiotransferase accessory factor
MEVTAYRSFRQVPTLDHATFNADLAAVLAQLRSVGLREVAVVDLSRPDIGVPVAKVVVPGLENNIHHDRRYRPGPRAARALGAAT